MQSLVMTFVSIAITHVDVEWSIAIAPDAIARCVCFMTISIT